MARLRSFAAVVQPVNDVPLVPQFVRINAFPCNSNRRVPHTRHYSNARYRRILSGGGHGMRRSRCTHTIMALGILLGAPTIASADEGGVSFWLPGLFGSLAATPLQPGWTLSTVYYHTSVSADADVARAREFTVGKLPVPVGVTANLSGNLNARADLALVNPTYVFEPKVLGGQLAVGVMGIYGRTSTDLAATLSGSVLIPPFFSIPFSRSDFISDSVSGFGDLYPQASLRWNAGVHNVMVYVTGDVPVGAYDPSRLSNIGIGHGAVDGGIGYTYFNPQTGHEFSGTLGYTSNMTNHSTQYRNGTDLHFDWGASQFLGKNVQVGAVGYVYEQQSGDSGAGDKVGPFRSRVVGIGPQLGFIIPVSAYTQAYLNIKGYKEFDHENRPAGWNTWVTLVLSPAEQQASGAASRRQARPGQTAARTSTQKTAARPTWTQNQVGAFIGASALSGNLAEPAGEPGAENLFRPLVPCGLPCIAFFPAGTSNVGTPFAFSESKGVVTGGGFLGQTMQIGNFVVVGIEADIAAKSGEASTVQTTPASVVYTPAAGGVTATRSEVFTGSIRQSWDVSLRPRVGFLVTPWTLLYFTAGIAFNHVNASFSYFSTATYTGIPGGLVDTVAGVGTLEKTLTGGTVGGGAEFALGGNVKARLEYRWSEFGGISFDAPLARTCAGNCFLPNIGSTNARVDLGNVSFHTVRAGLGFGF
jgi:opacity protein-like surface antigen